MKKRSLTVGSLLAGKQPSTPVRPAAPARPLNEPATSKKPTAPIATVTLKQKQSSFAIQAAKGQTLLNAALAQQQPIDFKCTKGTCGRCSVQVLSGQSLLSAPNEKEREKLKNQVNSGNRLACQALFK